ncbi:hypothetical protein [Streptomyces sp. NPDC007984]|uniref:hypothetical protein n=1 Tax=Streptomyces sp. NPDC007984 TaxID=3364801 RepID=UPI0036E9AF80
MTKKKKKRPAKQYQLPPHITRSSERAAEARAWRPRPPLPPRRLILSMIGLCLLSIGIVLSLTLPSHFLVEDLRSRGVSAAATVVGVDSKPKYVKVRLVSSPKAGTRVKLWDYAGMLPETEAGASMIVTYDPEDPSRILTQSWVKDPPINLPAYGTSALAAFFLLGTVALVFRRRWVLRNWPSDVSVAGSAKAHGSTSVRLTKP